MRKSRPGLEERTLRIGSGTRQEDSRVTTFKQQEIAATQMSWTIVAELRMQAIPPVTLARAHSKLVERYSVNCTIAI